MPAQTAAILGLGLAALGRPGYINLGHSDDLADGYDVQQMQNRAHAVMDVAHEIGIQYFDAARSYGRAEHFLAAWLQSRKIAPQQLTIASKWGYAYTADWKVTVPDGAAHEVKEHSLQRLNEQYVETQQQLGQHLDLYQIHSATLESGVLSNSAVLDRLAELRDSGLRIGLSVSGTKQSETILRALECKRNGQDIFSAVQATWNLLETSAAPALQQASDAGWKVIVKEGVANGRLTDRNQAITFATKRESLQHVADSYGVTIDAVALSAALIQPWASVVLSGATTADQLRSNAKAIDIVNKRTPEQIDQLSALQSELQEPADTYWAKRSQLPWN